MSRALGPSTLSVRRGASSPEAALFFLGKLTVYALAGALLAGVWVLVTCGDFCG